MRRPVPAPAPAPNSRNHQQLPETQTAKLAAVRIKRRTLIAMAAAACATSHPEELFAQPPVQPASFTDVAPIELTDRNEQKSAAGAASFVMTNEVFASDGSPIEAHEIVFDQGRAYDFTRSDDRFVTVFDITTETVTLLDRTNRSKAIVAGETLLKAAIQTEAMLSGEENATDLGVQAKVDVSPDQTDVTTNYGDTTYQVSTVSVADRAVTDAYAQFVELASRLNLVRHRGGPPFARLRVYEQIRQLGRLPVQTNLVRKSADSTQAMRATHQRGTIAEQHRRRINEVAGMMTLYKSVDLDSFEQ